MFGLGLGEIYPEIGVDPYFIHFQFFYNFFIHPPPTYDPTTLDHTLAFLRVFLCMAQDTQEDTWTHYNSNVLFIFRSTRPPLRPYVEVSKNSPH